MCSSNGFGAYHGWTGQLIYAAIPYAPSFNCGNFPQLPNHDAADQTITIASHEQIESTSDPYGTGWIDANNEEEADKCSFTFGPTASDGSDVNWNGHPYIVQEEWSNTLGACTLGNTSATPTPTVTPTSTPTTPPTSTPTATPTSTPVSGSTCKVSYVVQNQWPGGFTANLTITNTGSTALNGWTLTFTFPDSQQVTQSWNSSVTQSGAKVTITNTSYNGQVPPGTAVNPGPGFNGSWNNSNPSPTVFILNGAVYSTS